MIFEYVGGPRDGLLEEFPDDRIVFPMVVELSAIDRELLDEQLTSSTPPGPLDRIGILRGCYRSELHRGITDLVWQGWE